MPRNFIFFIALASLLMRFKPVASKWNLNEYCALFPRSVVNAKYLRNPSEINISTCELTGFVESRNTMSASINGSIFGVISCPLPFISITANAAMSEIGRCKGLFCHSSFANQPATTISATMPNMTIHSPRYFADSHRRNSAMLLNHLFSDSASIKSPTNTMTPPMQANNTNQKIDPVVISIYAMLSVVVIGTLVCFAIFIIGRRKGVY